MRPTLACKSVPVALEVACVACAHNTADTCTHARARIQAITAGIDCTQGNGRSKSNATRRSMCHAAYQAAGIAQKRTGYIRVSMGVTCVTASRDWISWTCQ